MEEECGVFVEVGACSEREIRARCECERQRYMLTVETEAKALVHTATQSVIPRAYAYLNTLPSQSSHTHVNRFSERFAAALDDALKSLEELEIALDSCTQLKEAS
jgi:glutamine synthetase type III